MLTFKLTKVKCGHDIEYHTNNYTDIFGVIRIFKADGQWVTVDADGKIFYISNTKRGCVKYINGLISTMTIEDLYLVALKAGMFYA